jgi:nitrile hydratase accessory protein
VFAEPWQAQVFALTLALHARGVFSWNDWTQALTAELKQHPESGPERYYEHWLCALESLLCARGLANRMTLSERKLAWEHAHRRTPHGAPVPAPTLTNDR